MIWNHRLTQLVLDRHRKSSSPTTWTRAATVVGQPMGGQTMARHILGARTMVGQPVGGQTMGRHTIGG